MKHKTRSIQNKYVVVVAIQQQIYQRNKNNAERAALYARLAGRLLSPEGRRLAPLASGQLSQGLDVADLFEVRRGEARGAALPMDKDAEKGSAQVGGSAA